MNTSLAHLPEIPILVIGYGNRKQEDLGAGYLVAKAIQKWKIDQVKALSVDMLTPNLAPMIMKAKTVIFIGSYHLYEHMKPEIIIKHFLPNCSDNDLKIVYDNPPQTLLAFIQAVYHKMPDAYWILMPAVNYQLSDCLSHTTQRAMEQTLKFLRLNLDTSFTKLWNQPNTLKSGTVSFPQLPKNPQLQGIG